MPWKPSRPCSTPGCPRMAVRGGHCAEHARRQRAAADAQRPTAAERGYGRPWQQVRAAFLQAHPYCELCGAPATDADHIIARARGGTDDESNLQALCHGCHSRKTASHDGGFGN